MFVEGSFQSFGDVVRRIVTKERGVGGLGQSSLNEAQLLREVSVCGSARDPGRLGDVGDRGVSAAGHEAAHLGDQGVTSARLLPGTTR